MQGGGKHLTAHLDPCGDRTELGGQVQARFACAEKKGNHPEFIGFAGVRHLPMAVLVTGSQ